MAVRFPLLARVMMLAGFIATCEHPAAVVAMGPGESDCPVGVECESEKCETQNGEPACCQCVAWNPDGTCLEGGWIRTSGTGPCDFTVEPAGQYDCQPGVVCEGSKCAFQGDGQVCCECVAWQPDGLCLDGAWVVSNGTGTCDFTVEPAGQYDCQPGVVCEGSKCAFQEDGQVCCECVAWQPDGLCLDGAWVVSNGTGTCDFEVDGVGEPVAEGDCPPDVTCESTKCQQAVKGETCCQCVLWDSEGVCLPGAWIVTSGPGNCDFEVP